MKTIIDKNYRGHVKVCSHLLNYLSPTAKIINVSS